MVKGMFFQTVARPSSPCRDLLPVNTGRRRLVRGEAPVPDQLQCPDRGVRKLFPGMSRSVRNDKPASARPSPRVRGEGEDEGRARTACLRRIMGALALGSLHRFNLPAVPSSPCRDLHPAIVGRRRLVRGEAPVPDQLQFPDRGIRELFSGMSRSVRNDKPASARPSPRVRGEGEDEGRARTACLRRVMDAVALGSLHRFNPPAGPSSPCRDLHPASAGRRRMAATLTPFSPHVPGEE